MSSSATEAFHFAKLSLFNVRLLSDIEHASKNHSEIARVIETRAERDSISLPVPLLHQAMFLQFGYICLVWLWEVSKANSGAQQIIDEVSKRFDIQGVIKSKDGEREINSTFDVVRLVRNAISHAHVVVKDEYFIFSDINKRGGEKKPTSIRLTWCEFGELSEAILFSVNSWLYQGHKPAKS